MEKWYVLQVMNNKEFAVQNQLEKRGISAAVPFENRVTRCRSKWTLKKYVVFPGYVFVCGYDFSKMAVFMRMRNIIRILGTDGIPQSLSDNEAELITKTSEFFKEPSLIRFHEERYEIMEGCLKNLQQYIKKIDRHARRAVVEMMIAGRYVKFHLSFLTTEDTVYETKAV